MERFRISIESKGSKVLFSFFIIQFIIFGISAIISMVKGTEKLDVGYNGNNIIAQQLRIVLSYFTDNYQQQPNKLMETQDENNATMFKWIVLIELYIIQLYYSYHAVLKQNVIELFTCLAISICTTFCGGFRFISVISHNNSENNNDSYVVIRVFALIQLVTSIALQIFFLVAAYYLWDIFKWKIFKKIGGNQQTQEMYSIYETCKAYIKAMVFMSAILLISFIFIIEPSSKTSFAVFIILVVLTITSMGVQFLIGYKGIRNEDQKLTMIYYGLFGFNQIVILVGIIMVLIVHDKSIIYIMGNFDPFTYIIAAALIACFYVISILALIYSIKAYKQFGKGLKEFLQSRKDQLNKQLMSQDDEEGNESD